MAIQVLHRTVVIAIKKNRAIVAGEDDDRVLGQIKAIECFHDFANLPVNLMDDIATHAALTRAGKGRLSNARHMRLEKADTQKEGFVLVALDVFHRFGDNGAGKFLVFEPRRVTAFHIADAADTIDDRAGVLLVRTLYKQVWSLQASWLLADVVDVADDDRVGRIKVWDFVIFNPHARHAVHGGRDDVGIIETDFQRAGF